MADFTVSWAENEGINSDGKRKSYSSGGVVSDGYVVIPVSRAELCFDEISVKAGWPPDLGIPWVNGGLLSYSIVVEFRDSKGETRSAIAEYIAHSREHDTLNLFVPYSDPAQRISDYQGYLVFTADADGVVKLAESEK